MHNVKKRILYVFMLVFSLIIVGCAAYPPNSAMGLNNQGASLVKSGRYTEAINYFNKALELKPRFAGALYNKGLAYSHKRKFEKAINAFNRAIEINPNYADALDSRGLLYLITAKDKQQACVDLNKACDLGVCKAYKMAKRKGDCS